MRQQKPNAGTGDYIDSDRGKPQTSSCQQYGETRGGFGESLVAPGESPEEEKGNPELANTNWGDNEGR